MSGDEHELIEEIRAVWAPPSSDPEGFDVQLRRRLERSQRRRILAGAGVVLVVAGLAALHLGQASDPGELPVVAGRGATAPPLARAVASVRAEPTSAAEWWDHALDPAQRSFDLPGEYGALDTLFLQTRDQEL